MAWTSPILSVLLLWVPAASMAGGKNLDPHYEFEGSFAGTSGGTVVALPADVRVRRVEQKWEKSDKSIDVDQVVAWLQEISANAQVNQPLEFLRSAGEEGADPSALETAIGSSRDLVRTNQTGEQRLRLLESVCRTEGVASLLVHHLELTLAKKLSWSPMSGAISIGLSSSQLRAVLVSCDTGEVTRRGELFVRATPGIGNQELERAIGAFYMRFFQEN